MGENNKNKPIKRAGRPPGSKNKPKEPPNLPHVIPPAEQEYEVRSLAPSQVHANSLANLKPVQPGEAGRNPTGRPVNRHSVDIRDEALAVLCGEIEILNKKTGTKEQLTRLRAILMRLATAGINGDRASAAKLFEYAFGRPVSQIQLTGKDGGPVEIDASGARAKLKQRLLQGVAAGETGATT